MAKENPIIAENNPWKDAPEDLAERVAEILSRIYSRKYNAKVTFRAVRREEQP